MPMCSSRDIHFILLVPFNQNNVTLHTNGNKKRLMNLRMLLGCLLTLRNVLNAAHLSRKTADVCVSCAARSRIFLLHTDVVD